jgi:hypothetical protein
MSGRIDGKHIFGKKPLARGYTEEQAFPRKAFFGRVLEAMP